jgi:hypothetical protein
VAIVVQYQSPASAAASCKALLDALKLYEKPR